MKITYETLPILDIRETPNNPRTIGVKDFERLKQSLKDFPEMMDVRAIVVDENNTILGGNMRYRALLDMGAKEAKVAKVDGLTDSQKREFIVKDNLNLGDWDFDKLEANFNPDDVAKWGLDVSRLLDLDLDDIESNQEREANSDSHTCKCPNCGREFDI